MSAQPMILSSSVTLVSANVTEEAASTPPPSGARRVSLTGPAVTVEPVATTPGSKNIANIVDPIGVRRSTCKAATISASSPRNADNSEGPSTPSRDITDLTPEEKLLLDERRRSSLAKRGSQGVIVCDVTIGTEKLTTKTEEVIMEEPAAKVQATEEPKEKSSCCVIL